jgi:hypothetical protein
MVPMTGFPYVRATVRTVGEFLAQESPTAPPDFFGYPIMAVFRFMTKKYQDLAIDLDKIYRRKKNILFSVQIPNLNLGTIDSDFLCKSPKLCFFFLTGQRRSQRATGLAILARNRLFSF